MATIMPFAALRPAPDLASRICELPYDVMSTEEARAIAVDNPLSFLHISKPEIDLPPETDPYSASVYARGAENFQRLIDQEALHADEHACFYLYRQVMGGLSQTGLVAVCSCREYLDGSIRKHELTRPDKEDDRVRHIEALNAQTGPAFLVYPARAVVDEFVATVTEGRPEVDFVAADGVRHSSWTVRQTAHIEFLRREFEQVPALYIADGHHRSAAAARVFQSRNGAGGSAYFLNVIFPHNQVKILPYNRVVKDLNGLTPASLLEKLDGVFVVERDGNGTPSRRHELGLFLAGRWHTLHFRPRFAATTDPVEKLDVTLLQKYVFDPIFGIDNPRTSKRLQFVGGVRGIRELETLVGSEEYACAFSMFPTGVEDLMTIADAGGIMPPKSTWFEPKLRDAMFCYRL